ncbi:hypothetical protein [Limosilactobacillus mucosae]|uniref:hypothetical protein n=1 Tax=uncultured Limosilactobacillus sp. TaxID=2837629 RepID=UPI0025940FBB|nr:hypothetical protein [uncultured Limosilactobacillus sp.]
MDVVSVISELIDDIYSLHNEFETKYLSERNTDFNLKKVGFTDIKDNVEFHEMIDSYVAQLRAFMLVNSIEVSYNSEDVRPAYQIKDRIKVIKTINKKIDYYAFKESKISKIPVAKGLNDFLGVRIISSDINENIEKIMVLLERKKNQKIISRYYYRNDGKYHAIHCYVKKDNHAFPWELQIWDVSNEQENFADHDRHEKEKDFR